MWTVSTDCSVGSIWDDSALESLGGKGTVARVWDNLKSSNLTGFLKRQASPGRDLTSKKLKLLENTNKVSKVLSGASFYV